MSKTPKTPKTPTTSTSTSTSASPQPSDIVAARKARQAAAPAAHAGAEPSAVGHQLACRGFAERLHRYRNGRRVIVLGVPPAGVELAAELARQLEVTGDTLVVRGLSVPSRPGRVLGAVTSGGALHIDETQVQALNLGVGVLESIIASETEQLRKDERRHRGSRPPLVVEGATVILVDEGITSGATMQAAVYALRSLRPASVVIAVCSAPAGLVQRYDELADEFICLHETCEADTPAAG